MLGGIEQSIATLRTKADELLADSEDKMLYDGDTEMIEALGKLDTAASLTASLKEYEIINGYLKRHPVEEMGEEAKVCREMAELLPHKIANARRAAQQQ